MPIFNYKCDECGREYAVMHKFSSPPESMNDVRAMVEGSCSCDSTVTKVIALSFNKTIGNKEQESRHRVDNMMNEMKEEIEESKKQLKDKSDG